MPRVCYLRVSCPEFGAPSSLSCTCLLSFAESTGQAPISARARGGHVGKIIVDSHRPTAPSARALWLTYINRFWGNDAWVAQQLFWPCERRARFLANAGRGDTGLPPSTRRPGAAAQKWLLSLLAPIMLRVVRLNNVCNACNFFTRCASWLCCAARAIALYPSVSRATPRASRRLTFCWPCFDRPLPGITRASSASSARTMPSRATRRRPT